MAQKTADSWEDLDQEDNDNGRNNSSQSDNDDDKNNFNVKTKNKMTHLAAAAENGDSEHHDFNVFAYVEVRPTVDMIESFGVRRRRRSHQRFMLTLQDEEEENRLVNKWDTCLKELGYVKTSPQRNAHHRQGWFGALPDRLHVSLFNANIACSKEKMLAGIDALKRELRPLTEGYEGLFLDDLEIELGHAHRAVNRPRFIYAQLVETATCATIYKARKQFRLLCNKTIFQEVHIYPDEVFVSKHDLHVTLDSDAPRSVDPKDTLLKQTNDRTKGLCAAYMSMHIKMSSHDMDTISVPIQCFDAN